MSIVDIAGGKQPIFSRNNKSILVFNGEIYNHSTLRNELLADGVSFGSVSDSEVVMRQYEADGPDCLGKFNGMFAIAIWNQTNRSLFLARDRLGIKPLYYYWDGLRFAFASELKALMSLDFVCRQLNQQSVWDYLTYRYVPGPEAIWKNIRKLAPGHFLSVRQHGDSGQIAEPQITRYWHMQMTSTSLDGMDWKQCTQEFETLFLESVRKRMIADVPVGVFLSGGLDSSAVAAAASETYGSGINTYSVAFANDSHDSELPYAASVASHLRTCHHEVMIQQNEFLDFLPQLVRHTDEPLADLTTVPVHYLSQFAARDVKVVLSGEGADETLGGYDLGQTSRRMSWLQTMRRLPVWARRNVLNFLAQSSGQHALKRIVEKINSDLLPETEIRRSHITNTFQDQEKRKLFGAPDEFEDSLLRLNNLASESGTKDWLAETLYILCQSWLVEDLLMKADKMSMANSLEVRVPFLDHQLVEWCAKLPSHFKVRLMWDVQFGIKPLTKAPLRAFCASRIPKGILRRPKRGFPVPVYRWLLDDLKHLPHDLLLSPDAVAPQLLSRAELTKLVKRTEQEGSMADCHRVWSLLIFEYWLREWQPSDVVGGDALTTH